MASHQPKSEPSYFDQTWHYLVREWKRDGPDEYLAIATNGGTDNVRTAFLLCQETSRPRHIYDTRADRIIHANYW